jgi:hypothetical protein
MVKLYVLIGFVDLLMPMVVELLPPSSLALSCGFYLMVKHLPLVGFDGLCFFLMMVKHN